MKPKRKLPATLLALLAAATGGAVAQDLLDTLDEALTLASPDGVLRADASVLTDLEVYVPDLPAPGLLFSDDDAFVNPRMALFLDLEAASRLRVHTQLRVDRGFDPGARPDGDARLDEAYLEWRPLRDDRLTVRGGMSPSVAGNWVPRHLSWGNPFITAPLPYEDVLGITDHSAPASPQAFVARRNVPDKKADWLPLLWGPSYATGLTVSGRLDWLDYAAEIKNASLSSRPYAWEPTNVNFERPTVTGRLGVRPGPEWALGASFSDGPYLLGDPGGTLPPGASLSDFDQTTFGIDAAYQHHHLQIWAEAFHSRFEVPRVGEAGITAYYIEAKYKLSARWWAALRWNQSFSGQVPDGFGGETDWDRDAWRADLSIGCRLTEHLQAKIQYSQGDHSGADPEGDRLLATQVTVRF